LRTRPSTPEAVAAIELVEALQKRFADGLHEAARQVGVDAPLQPVEWLRDAGRHGGGVRLVTGDSIAYDRASVNVSSVHYDDLPDKKLASATALSAIVHPRPPRAPSLHTHISHTQMRDGRGYWRLMADLNPSIPDEGHTQRIESALRQVTGELYDAASAQGDRYFHIPALGRHRGVTHFYLEGYDSGDFEADLALARRFGEAVIDAYCQLLQGALKVTTQPGDTEQQRAYHTLYLFQVLTLDRGTTSGLLVHSDNDVGILGSLPSAVDRDLLASWADRVPSPQDELVRTLVSHLPEQTPSPVTPEVKRALAQAVRAHYRAHPEALALQARGDVVPPTVDNHRSS
jgi:coproporphyrinogen III oxidase